jgi:two-component system, sensor histidine kinase PdtaS
VPVPSVTKVLEQRTELSTEDIDYLDSLIQQWSVLADLALSDLVLWVPIWNEGGLLAVAQVRASTAPTSLNEEIVGAFSPRGRNTVLDRAEALGQVTALRQEESEVSPMGVEAYPVRFNDRIIAVVARYPSPAPRVVGELERVYLQSADLIFQMISRGQVWMAAEPDSIEFWDRPRVGDGMLSLNSEGTVTYASPNATSAFRRLGLATNLIGQKLDALISKLDESPAGISKKLERISQGGVSGFADVQGAEATIMMNSVALNSSGNMGMSRTIILLKDVTALRRQQRDLLSKDATIREINHRVKNNLQMVNSILRLQSRRAKHEETKNALNDAQQRISAISAIHDVLSQDVVTTVNFDALIDSIIAASTDGSSGISVKRLGTGGNLPTVVAAPLAMSVSELLHNALEHSQSSGVVIKLHRSARALTCSVEDNGIGMAAEPGLGLSIVTDLITKELRGEFGFVPMDSPGTTAQIHIALTRAMK